MVSCRDGNGVTDTVTIRSTKRCNLVLQGASQSGTKVPHSFWRHPSSQLAKTVFGFKWVDARHCSGVVAIVGRLHFAHAISDRD